MFPQSTIFQCNERICSLTDANMFSLSVMRQKVDKLTFSK